jgi:glycine C-acetyltransferase
VKPSTQHIKKPDFGDPPGQKASGKTRVKLSGANAADHFQDFDYSNFFSGTGEDPFCMLDPMDEWWNYAHPAGYYQFELPLQTAPGPVVNLHETLHNEDLQGLVNFASYNYLGLSYREEVIEAAVEATRKYGLGASGSPILSGTLDLHTELAEKLAQFKQKETALLFPTGYSANVGTISALMRAGDTVICDQFSHASIVDGIILSKATCRFFRHNNVEDLEKKLTSAKGKKLVVVEGVYSMDGDLPPLPEIVEVCKRHGARLMIDEAHSTFVFGEHGRGVAEHFGLEDEVDIHFGTFSKSLGGIGGFVVGPFKLINYLKGFARSRVFSCALPPGVTGGMIKALEIAQAEPELRKQLWDNVDYAHKLLHQAGVDVGNSQSQVIPIMVRDDWRIFYMGTEMLKEGVYLNPIAYPAVGKHRSRFRMSISAAHTREQLDRGTDAILRVLRRNDLCP